MADIQAKREKENRARLAKAIRNCKNPVQLRKWTAKLRSDEIKTDAFRRLLDMDQEQRTLYKKDKEKDYAFRTAPESNASFQLALFILKRGKGDVKWAMVTFQSAICQSGFRNKKAIEGISHPSVTEQHKEDLCKLIDEVAPCCKSSFK